MRKLLVIFAVALGLEDEEVLVNKHRYEERSGDHLRYMKYYARSEEENRKLGGVWLKGYFSPPNPARLPAKVSVTWERSSD